LRSLARYQDALDDFETAIGLMKTDYERQDWHLWYARGLVYVDLELYDLAIKGTSPHRFWSAAVLKALHCG
jgi:hypothetical protein